MATLATGLLARFGRDLHPLDSNKKFHHLIFGSSSSKLSQRINNVGDLKHSLSAREHALVEERHFALLDCLRVPTEARCESLGSGTQFDPCISSVRNRDHDYYCELLVKSSGPSTQLLGVRLHTFARSERDRVRTEL